MSSKNRNMLANLPQRAMLGPLTEAPLSIDTREYHTSLPLNSRD